MTASTVPPVASPRDHANGHDALDCRDAAADLVREPRRPEPAEPDTLPADEPPELGPDLPPAAGPTARLMALPQPQGAFPTTPAGVDQHLARFEAARQAQLDALPQTPLDKVAAAHRGTVERILEQVRAARRRVIDGVYGICVGCGTGIPPERLELRPWLITCTGCASRDRL